MGEDSQNNQDSFDEHYNRFKDGVLPKGLRLAESERILSDKIITQYLQRNFNEEAGIPMDRMNLRGTKVLNIEEMIIEANNKNWQLDQGKGFASDTVTSISAFFFGEEQHDKAQKTPEQLLSDQNAIAYLNQDASESMRLAVENIVAHIPSLAGFTLEDAKGIARADLSTEGNGADILAKFPDADPNTLRAVAYSLLHVSKVDDQDLQGQDFDETARSYMHYAHEESKPYDEWEMDRRIEIMNAITGNPEIMADLLLIKAPGNIETASDLQSQFRVRERVADAVTEAVAKVHGMSDTLDGDDVTVVYKSGADIMEDKMLGYMHTSITSGILNDETIILRYNPAYFLRERPTEFAHTDSEEVEFFLKSALEEIQHGVDHVQTDRLILGTLPEGAPLEHHVVMSALSRLTYADHEDYEAYSTQYVEKAAKAIADDVTFEVVYILENPEEGSKQAVEQNSDNSADTVIEQSALPTDASLPFKI